jgi:undecaprenyl diphosphate synthase
VEVRVLGDLDRSRRRRGAPSTRSSAHRGRPQLRLNLMISYGGRAEIVRAARRLAERVERGELRPRRRSTRTRSPRELYTADIPTRPADPHVRRAADQQLPALAARLHRAVRHARALAGLPREHLFQAIYDYQRRERRFGRVTAG